jgi:hypothetical protein
LDNSRIANRLAENRAVPHQAFCARLDANASVHLDNGSEHGRGALLANLHKLFGKRPHFAWVIS